MSKHLYFKIFIAVLFCLLGAQDKIYIERLLTKGAAYYNQGDYSNAIIIYEDLLAEQELIIGSDDIQIAETLTRLGELYSITGMKDKAEYYFQEASTILEKVFQARKESLEDPLLNLLKIYSLNPHRY